MKLEIKDICYINDIDGYCSKEELKELSVYTTKKNLNDFFEIKKYVPEYKNMVLIEEEVTENKINGYHAIDYFKRGHLPFFENHIWRIEKADLPFDINFDFIYTEDFNDLGYLENIANEKNAKIFTTKSFQRRSSLVFSYKSDLTIIQKIYLIKKAKHYVGFDFSCMAPLAKFHLKENSEIYQSSELSDEERMFRFINEDNIDFFKI
jgi:hypothetical protein